MQHAVELADRHFREIQFARNEGVPPCCVLGDEFDLDPVSERRHAPFEPLQSKVRLGFRVESFRLQAERFCSESRIADQDSPRAVEFLQAEWPRPHRADTELLAVVLDGLARHDG